MDGKILHQSVDGQNPSKSKKVHQSFHGTRFRWPIHSIFTHIKSPTVRLLDQAALPRLKNLVQRPSLETHLEQTSVPGLRSGSNTIARLTYKLIGLQSAAQATELSWGTHFSPISLGLMVPITRVKRGYKPSNIMFWGTTL